MATGQKGPGRTLRPRARSSQIVVKLCAAGGGDLITEQSAAAHANDLADLETLAESYGSTIDSSALDQIFRKPDSVKQSLVI